MKKETINEYLCPALLAATECFASLYAFHQTSAYVLAVFFLAETVLLFRFFSKLHTRKSGAFIYTLLLAVISAASVSVLWAHASVYGISPTLQWIYGQTDEILFLPDLVAAIALGGSFFLISIIYYFTVILFRPLGVMLCTMFPFFCFTMRSDKMPEVLITLIMLLFLAVLIHNGRLNRQKKTKTPSGILVDRAYILCLTAFILVTGTITIAVKKPERQALFERNANIITQLAYGGESSTAPEYLSDRSSARNARQSFDFDPLFSFKTDSDGEIFYLRRKAFRIFNGDVWVDNSVYEWSAYSQSQPEYGTDDILSDYGALTGRDLSGLYTVSSGRVFDDSFSPSYLPAPLGIITDDLPANGLLYYKLQRDTSVYRAQSFYYARKLDDSFSYFDTGSRLYRFAGEEALPSEDYLAFLESFGENAEATRLKNDYTKAATEYKSTLNISDKLTALAEKITAVCHSDLEKAEALERYFRENGFVYSLDFVPEDNSIDYFVFESKTGYCANYATAMTLMARAVGLPARYVEGFAAFEKQEDGTFLIRDGYAHAFVEVYIPGAGWLTFDPTVPDYRNNPLAKQQQGSGLFSGNLKFIKRISVIIIIALIALISASAEKIREAVLRASLVIKPLNERILILYRNVIRTAGKSADKDLRSYTPDLLRNYLSENRGVTLNLLIDLFEKTAFGGYVCSKEEYRKAYKEYKCCFKYIRKDIKKP